MGSWGGKLWGIFLLGLLFPSSQFSNEFLAKAFSSGRGGAHGTEGTTDHATDGHHWMAAVLSALFEINGIAMVRSLVPLHYSPYVREL